MINKIVIAGGNGFLGSLLCDYFENRAKQIVVIARKEVPLKSNLSFSYWDGEHFGEWTKQLENADVLINLSGKSVNCRYTEENKKSIYDSRIKSTLVLGRAVEQCINPPKVWINASSATIYKASYNTMRTEEGEVGDGFSVDVCKKWEDAFNKYPCVNTRKIILRIGIVLGNKGGALSPLKNLVSAGMGGKQGDGKQFCSWIHEKDFCRAVDFLINSLQAEGIYNVTAPVPLPNKNFMQALRNAKKMPVGIGIPKTLLALGAIFISTESELVLKSRKVYPKRLLDEGFVFEFNAVNEALENLCNQRTRTG